VEGHHLQYGVSITDPCLDWASTVQLIEEVHFTLKTVPCYAASPF
jgi:phospho-2-dehydro-3-deoxyheptonate aldolase